MTSDAMVLTHKCRLQPTLAQRRALERVLEQQRQLYNAALEERIDCYRKTGRSLTAYDQGKSLTVIRQGDPDFSGVQRRIQCATLDKLDRAYKAFFRRARQGAGASSGFPKFKGRDHFDGFGFNAPLQIKWDGKRLRFAGMAGGIRVSKRDRDRLPKPLFSDPKGGGNWKGIWFKREGERWSVGFQCEVPIKPRVGCGSKPVGVDWGTSMLAALSTDETIPNPRPGEALAKAHKRAQRAVSRKRKGSKSRRKARKHLQAVARKVANRRKNHLDKVSKRLVTHFGLVAIEDIAVQQMTRSAKRKAQAGADQGVPASVTTRRNREALDAAPYMLRQMLAYKAKLRRCDLRIVEAAGTTEEAWARMGTAPPRGSIGDPVPRKFIAARVILDRAMGSPGETPASEGGPALGGAPSGANQTARSGRLGNTGRPRGRSGRRPESGPTQLRTRDDEPPDIGRPRR